jgi:23S rRNA (uracil1939-C5)-methyltransferase
MARGEIFTARIEGIAAGGAGIARVGGKTVFVDLSAPLDFIKGRIILEQKSWSRAELLEILEPSPLRITPLCPVYGRCGGCTFQHLNYEAQIEAKTQILQDALKRIGGFVPPEIKVKRSKPYEYRNRVQFHCTNQFHRENNELCFSFSFKERKSSSIVAIKDCPVADKGIREALKKGTIHPPMDKERFTVYSHGECFLVEGENEKGAVSILDRKLHISAAVFFQSNAAMLELLLGDLLSLSSLADKNLPLADLYCGVGTFAAFLAHEFPEIELVEANKAALALAKENLDPGKKVNYHALTDTIWANSQKGQSFGFLVLDPPREGLSKQLRDWLSKCGPGIVAYVSCDPATLARDSKSLLEGGYSLKELTFYDFYPQTAHIESLALFCRK